MADLKRFSVWKRVCHFVLWNLTISRSSLFISSIPRQPGLPRFLRGIARHFSAIGRPTFSAIPRPLTVPSSFGDRIAGNIGAWTDAGSGERLISYWLSREFWGQGIATAAVSLLLRLESIRPLIAHVASHNLGSIRVLEKSGFTRVGEDRFSLPDHPTVEEIIYRLSA